MIRRILMLWFRTSGWTYSGRMADFQPKSIICAGPHIGLREFMAGIALLSIIGHRCTVLVNKHHFRLYSRALLYKLSCRPINSRLASEELQRLASTAARIKKCSYAVASHYLYESENHIFYKLAERMKVPLVLVTIDTKKKHIKIYSEFLTSGNFKRDIAFCDKVFGSVR